MVTNALYQLVDTTLAKLLLANADQLPSLIAILDGEAHACDVDELASLLESNGLHWHLSQLYLRQGRVGEVLRIWTESACFIILHRAKLTSIQNA